MDKKEASRSFRLAATLAIMLLVELAVSAIPAGILAAALIPLAEQERGYFAIGGEWLAVAATLCCTYCAVHLWLCKKLCKEG